MISGKSDVLRDKKSSKPKAKQSVLSRELLEPKCGRAGKAKRTGYNLAWTTKVQNSKQRMVSKKP